MKKKADMKDESENDRRRRKTSTEENSVTIYEEMLKKTQEERHQTKSFRFRWEEADICEEERGKY